MMKKNILPALLAVSILGGNQLPVSEDRGNAVPRERSKRLPNGCSEFAFGKLRIIALNKKNAERKFAKYQADHGIVQSPKIKSF